MELYKLGTNEIESGTWTYQQWTNPLLLNNVKSLPDGRGMNPDDYANPDAASVLAEVAGGKVRLDPEREAFNTSVKALAIQTEGGTVNAGRVLMVMGNDSGYATPEIKSVEMCKLLAIEEDREFAEKLWTALSLKPEWHKLLTGE